MVYKRKSAYHIYTSQRQSKENGIWLKRILQRYTAQRHISNIRKCAFSVMHNLNNCPVHTVFLKECEGCFIILATPLITRHARRVLFKPAKACKVAVTLRRGSLPTPARPTQLSITTHSSLMAIVISMLHMLQSTALRPPLSPIKGCGGDNPTIARVAAL